MMNNYYSLQHHGILGQKWGIRRFQNADGTWTARGKKRRNNGQVFVRKKSLTPEERVARNERIKKTAKTVAKNIGRLAITATAAYVGKNIVSGIIDSGLHIGLENGVANANNMITSILNPDNSNKIPYSYGPRPTVVPKNRMPMILLAVADALGVGFSPATASGDIMSFFADARPHTASLSNVVFNRRDR